MTERIIRSGLENGTIDADVPIFGRHWGELRRTEERTREYPADLVEASLKRICYFAGGGGEPPYLFVPYGEIVQHHPIPESFWQKYPHNPEGERGRVEIMLGEFQSRGFPRQFEPLITRALSKESPLEGWKSVEEEVNIKAGKIYSQVLTTMQKEAQAVYNNGYEVAYTSDPVFYETSNSVISAESELWESSLSQMSIDMSDGNYENVSAFLNLYSRVKDPITPVLPTQIQTGIFEALYKEAMNRLGESDLSDDQRKSLVAQIASESSFLALPGVHEIVEVNYSHHQQLPYIEVDIAKLPRGEFAGPKNVLKVMKEFIKDRDVYGTAVVTPITVSYMQRPGTDDPFLFIVDGNNRSTAMLAFRYFHEEGYDLAELSRPEKITQFAQRNLLDIEWEYDLIAALAELKNHPDTIDLIRNNSDLVGKIAGSKMPALLVQEPNFFTIAVDRSDAEKVETLQAMHQEIYNRIHPKQNGEITTAIPAKKQSHGRAIGNNIKFTLNHE